ncbi:hypothetical protein MOQ72_26920 [Saccharopolyspora sp. K220]|uniref:hypothetical protein n=1 Tax=Saccharopolyspora soli TaxID=2926618 RepID=UPI001F57FA29|nr:hypothetical protein [Saccharopolyspora soli]MCI2421081.1 hypothetical protein [Saccharopolyspora soli]
MHTLAEWASIVLAQTPTPTIPPGIPDNVDSHVPPGAEKLLDTVGIAKFISGIALLMGFFAGLAVWAGGRWVDHHRAGRVGTIMMLVSVAGGIAYAVGPQVINWFAEG